MTIPSRRANPFATCWVNPDTAPLCVVDEETLRQLIDKLKQPGAQGAIVGPHGSGKTTVARRVADHFRCEGWRVYWSELHDGKRDDAGVIPAANEDANALQVVDGYEQLGWFQRWRIRRRCRRSKARLLVTSHSSTSLPTLLRLEPDIETALEVFRQLTAEIPTRVTPKDVAAAFKACKGNLRDVLFQLYDLHELRKSGERQGISASRQHPAS